MQFVVLTTIFFIIFFFSVSRINIFVTSKTKTSKYFIISSIVLFCSFLVLSFLSYSLVINTINKENLKNNMKRDYNYEITDYHVRLDVLENNQVNVEEQINVNILDNQTHGIYRVLPMWLEYTNKDGETTSRKSLIKNINVSEYFVSNLENGKIKIKIGDKDKFLGVGPHSYKINYTYDMGKDLYEGYDEFIFHAFGDYWTTSIKNASIEIHMPKNIDAEKVNFFDSKKYRDEFFENNTLDYYVSGNSIYASTKDDKNLYKALTVDVVLPEGYFNGENNVYGNKSRNICIICVIIGLLTIGLWYKYGKDNKLPSSMEFYPPNNLDPADLAYIYKGDGGKKLAIALIVSLATKGYILINEIDGNIVISKKETSEIERKPLTDNEILVYNKLFENSNENVLKEDKSFYHVYEQINNNVANKFIDVINDVKSYRMKIISACLSLFACIILYLALTWIEDMEYTKQWLYYIAFVSNIISFVFANFMSRKSTYGEELNARVRGFKKYIETVTTEEVKNNLTNNSYYYYDILPYAYVLGLTSKWSGIFKNLSISIINTGNYSITDSTNIDRLSSNTYGDSSGSSSGGCSSCGGGCSSCGGGGSW